MRKRQSNNPEYCPRCLVRLANRMAAVSHYRAHVRKGELLERLNQWSLIDDEARGLVWWSHGFRLTTGTLESMRDMYLNIRWRRQAGLK